MYAIIKSGGKQYRVQEGDMIDVELLNSENGSTIDFDQILFLNDGTLSKVGNPILSECFVRGELVGSSKGPKITSVKYQPGNHYKKFGHRQKYSRVKITGIGLKKEAKHGS